MKVHLVKTPIDLFWTLDSLKESGNINSFKRFLGTLNSRNIKMDEVYELAHFYGNSIRIFIDVYDNLYVSIDSHQPNQPE